MAISLQKGQKISLKKEDNTSLQHVIVGLGWDPARFGKSIDCDASALLLQNDVLKHKHKDVVCYMNLKHESKSVIHCGDNLTGDGDGDDEQIKINLPDVPDKYNKIVIIVNIFGSKLNRQHFGMIKNAYIRIVDADTNTEIMRYNLSDNYDDMKGAIFGELYRHNDEWKFHAIGQGTKDSSISDIAKHYR